MPITSIQRDQNNNVSLVRIISTDSLAAIDGTNYIEMQQDIINQLNGGTWQWFITDMLLIAADDGNAFFEFIDDTFTSLVIFGAIGSGIINPGMTNQLPYYSANGRVLSPLTNMANAILATNGSQVPGLTQTLPTAVQANITTVGTVGTGIWNGTPVTVPFGGSGLSTLTAYAVLCGGTTSTGNMQQVSGLGTLGQILTSNGAGALPTWQASPGSGTVSPGLQNQVAYYAANGSTVSGLTSIASGVLITSGLGVPSISQTLPSTVQGNITALGTIGTGIWQATTIGATYGGSGVSNPTAHGIMVAEGASPMTPIVLSSGQILIGSTGLDPVAAAINSGTGVLVANGAGSITVGLANANNNTIKSNISGISAAPVDNTLTAIIDSCIASTQGNVLYRNATSWVALAPGTSGQFLTTGGAAANVSWTSQTASSVTFTGDAGTPFSGSAVTFTGGTTGLTFTASSPSMTLGGTLVLANGGSNANLTASNGGIIYSTSTAMAVLAGTATAGQLLQSGSNAAPSWTSTLPQTVLNNITAPTVQKFLSGSGTYTTPANCKYIRVVAVAGGGGGAGSGTTNGGGQTVGGDTTFGSIITMTGGNPGTAGVFGGTGGTGGAATTNTASPGGFAVAGGDGMGGNYGPATTGVLNTPGGAGGGSILGGAGSSSFNAGTAGRTNTGGGGGGGPCVAAGPGGGGGGAGAGCDVLITSPAATYAYAVGAGGTAGAAGTNGAVGYAGGSGILIVYEYYV